MIDSHLLRYNFNDTKFIIFDFETEGLNLCYSRPWEMAWNVYHGKRLVEEHQYFVKWPNLNVSKKAAEVTGFKIENIEKLGREPREIVDLFDSYIYNPEFKLITANGLGFDVYIHNVARKLMGYSTNYTYLSRMYDTIALSRAYRLNLKIPADKSMLLPFQYKMLSIIQKGMKSGNADMAAEFNITMDKSKLHIAKYDNGIAFQVFTNLVEKLNIQ